jgi:DNA-binding CsgD family transcriptional regulator
MGDRSLGDRLQALMPLLRQGLVSDGDAEELFALLRDTLGASAFVLGQALDYRAWNLHRDVPEGWVADHNRLRREDPSIPLLAGSPSGTWFLLERDFTLSARRTEIYERWCASGLRDAAIVKLYSPVRDDLYFALMREDRPFSPGDLALLELLYPHLASALASRRAIALLEDAAMPRHAFVVVSFPDGVVRADVAARRAVERRTGPLGAIAWEKATRAIAVAARGFSHAVGGGRSQVLWPGLRIDFATLRAEPGETARLIGFLVDENDLDEEPDAAPPLVEALLSPRQLAVARDFVSGMAIATIAEMRRLSVETVRTHLREAYRKLGVRGRTALSRALTG